MVCSEELSHEDKLNTIKAEDLKDDVSSFLKGI